MARVYTQKAGKDYPKEGIKKGQVYYKWTIGFRGREQKSATRPRRSQTIGSPTLSAAVACYESFEEAVADATSPEDVRMACEEAESDADSVMSDFEEKINNLEEAFQGGCPALEEANEQKDLFESWKDELSSFSADSLEPDAWPDGKSWDEVDDDELREEWLSACREEVLGYSFDL